MRQAARIDANHREVVKALRGLGAKVRSSAALGDGFPDLIVGFRGHTLLVEVKDGSKPPSKRKRSIGQLRFAQTWPGDKVLVVYSPEDAVQKVLAAVGML